PAPRTAPSALALPGALPICPGPEAGCQLGHVGAPPGGTEQHQVVPVPGPSHGIDHAGQVLAGLVRAHEGHVGAVEPEAVAGGSQDRKSTRLNSSHVKSSYAV